MRVGGQNRTYRTHVSDTSYSLFRRPERLPPANAEPTRFQPDPPGVSSGREPARPRTRRPTQHRGGHNSEQPGAHPMSFKMQRVHVFHAEIEDKPGGIS